MAKVVSVSRRVEEGTTIDSKISLVAKNQRLIKELLEENEKALEELRNRELIWWNWCPVSVASQKLNVCVATVYNLIRNGELESKKIGDKVYVKLGGDE